jgi:adenylate kinase family enzyme
MIVGLPGAGKSTFAHELSVLLSIPCYSIDKYYWKPGWQKHAPHEWTAIHKKLIDNEHWIIEGCAIKSSFMERFERADLVVYFKYSRLLCLWRMFKRRWFAHEDTSHRPEGCSEGLPWRLIKYMWTFDNTLMSTLLPQAQLMFAHVRVVVVRNDSHVQQLWFSLKEGKKI